MAFTTDRDLLALEPRLFAEVSWSGQRLIDAGDGALSGTALSAPGADFEAAGVGAGHVAVIGGTPVEVAARVDATTLEASLVRTDPEAPAIPAPNALAGRVVVTTFAAQIEAAHCDLLRRAGLEEASGVLNGREAAPAEAAGALAAIYRAASGGGVASAALAEKAAWWEERAARLRSSLRLLIDLNADGEAESARFLAGGQLRRG